MLLKNKIYFFFIFTLCLFSCKVQELSSKVYPYTHEKFVFPEIEYIKDKPNVGIAFSGGGPRSASLTTGQLRALNKLGLLDKVKYISAVSGGAWASICYSYYPKDNINTLLGNYKKPQELRVQTLKKQYNGDLVKSISNAYIFNKYVKYAEQFKGDEIYANILSEIYLAPIGLGQNKYVGYNSITIDSLINRNLNKKHLTKEDFYTYKNDKPYLIVNGTVIGKLFRSWRLPSMHLEMTPLYTGVTYYNEFYKRKIGGGYIETFAIDNKFIRKEDINHLIFKKRKNKFSLGDMMAITGNAPGTWANRLRIGSFWGLPEIRFISIPETLKQKNGSKKIKNKEFPVADGGNMENLGLIPLLKRNVKKIVVFLNSKQVIDLIEDENGDEIIRIDNALKRVFGVEIKDKKSINSIASEILGNKAWISNLYFNILDKDAKKKFIIYTNLLKNENNEYLKLAKELYKKKTEGKPLIYKGIYKVNKNPDYGIFPIKDKTDEVQITWVYNDGFEKKYLKKLKPEVKSFYYNKGFNSGNSKFPHLPTFGTSSKGRAIGYETEWTNLLSHFSSWVVMDNRKVFEDFIKN